MQTWSRLILFIIPHWRQLFLSLIFGGFAALLWSAELALTFPLTITFSEHRTLSNYVRNEIEQSERLITAQTAIRENLDQELALLSEDGTTARQKARVKVLNARTGLQQKLTTIIFRVWIFSWIETRVLPKLPSDSFQMFGTVFGLVLVVTFFKGLCGYAQDSVAGCVAELVTMDMRQTLFRRTLQLDPQTIAISGTPKLMNDFTYTLQQLSAGLGDLGGRIVREPLKAGACIIAMFFVSWPLTLMLLAFIPLAGWMFHLFGQTLKRTTRRSMESVGQMYKCLDETFVNLKAVIAFGTAGHHRRDFHRKNVKNYQQSMRMTQIRAVSDVAVELLAVFAILAVLLPAGYMVLRQTTSICGVELASAPPTFPELAMFYALLAGVIDPLRKFSKFYLIIRQTGVLADQVVLQMDRTSLVPASASPQWLPRLSRCLEFRDVFFTYARASHDDSLDRGSVLNGLDLRIEYGEVLAVVGENGSGKSTLAGLLPRFYDPDRGVVEFDGIDLRSVRLRELRDQIAVVSQDTHLFDDTIRANIRYGKWNATDAEILAAARHAHVVDFTDNLPRGLETPVGEGGRQLSGGQRQRVSLARAILRDPQILILDEPTSAIDAESELLIHQALKDFVRGRTTIIITHSLSPALLEYVSRIAVLDRGRVVAMGSHLELQAACPMYGQLFDGALRSAA